MNPSASGPGVGSVCWMGGSQLVKGMSFSRRDLDNQELMQRNLPNSTWFHRLGLGSRAPVWNTFSLQPNCLVAGRWHSLPDGIR